MSWEHGTFGWEAYEAFVTGLRSADISYAEEKKPEAYVRGQDLNCGGCHGYCDYDLETEVHSGNLCPCCKGTCGHRQNLRIARWTTPNGRKMVVEEYLAVEDHDCDGESSVDIAVYEKGQRPDLESRKEILDPL